MDAPQKPADPIPPVPPDALLAQTLLREGRLGEDQIEAARKTLAGLRARGQTISLGRLLVEQGLLKSEDLPVFLRCGPCGKMYRVKNWSPGKTVFCPTCSTALGLPSAEETIDADDAKPPASGPTTAEGEGRMFGRYRLLKQLGRGGMGVVWKAFDTQLKREVALKQILGSGDEAPEILARFISEARAAAALRHPNIIAIHDVGEQDGKHFFTMDYVHGLPLDEFVQQKRPPARRILEIIRDVARALHAAHEQGIIHRDVKPGNVLIDGGGKPYVMDFGLAKDIKGEIGARLTLSGAVMGTPSYLSPEQAEGRSTDVGPHSDQFSLGVTLYEVLAGRLPFEGANIHELISAILDRDPIPLGPRIHRDVQTICLKALEKPRARRYAGVKDFADDIDRYLDGEPIVARPVSRLERIARRVHKHRAIVIPTAAAVVLGLGFAGWAGWGAVRKSGKVRDALRAATEAEKAEHWQKARDLYRSAHDLDEKNDQANAGFERTDKRLKEIAAKAESEHRSTKAQSEAQKEAIQLLESGRSAIDQAFRYLYNPRAEYEELVKRVDAGQKLIQQALEKDPNLPVAHYLMGRAWEIKGEDDKAEACWRRSIDLDPNFGPAHFMLARLLLAKSLLLNIGVSFEEQKAGAPEAERLAAIAGDEIAAAQHSGFDDELQKTVAGALQAFARRDYPSMDSIIDSALKSFARSDGVEELYFLKGLSRAGLPDDLEYLDTAIDLRPKFVMALFIRSNRRRDRGNLAGARSDLDELLKIKPKFLHAYNNRGVIRGMLGDHVGEIADENAALAIDPSYVTALCNRGGARTRLGQLKEAEADFDQAIKLFPGFAEAYFSRGAVRRMTGNLSGAKSDCDEAIKIRPRFKAAFYNRGLVLQSAGNLNDAISDYTEAIGIEPPTAEPYNNRGVARKELGNRKGAIEDFDAALKVNPDFPEALFNRGVFRNESGDKRGAMEDYNRALQIEPAHFKTLNARGILRYQTGDASGAVADWDASIKSNPNFAEPYNNRGYVKFKMGDAEGGLADINRAIELDGRNADALASRAEIREAKGDVDGAIEDYSKALQVAGPAWSYGKTAEKELEKLKRRRSPK